MPVEEPHRVICQLDRLLEQRAMTLAALAEAVGVTVVNLSILKNNRAKAVRFSTLTAICEVLDCEIGDLLRLGDPVSDARARTATLTG
jgi:putative transcriptional regulator